MASKEATSTMYVSMLEQHHEKKKEEKKEEKAFKYRGDHSLVSPYSSLLLAVLSVD